MPNPEGWIEIIATAAGYKAPRPSSALKGFRTTGEVALAEDKYLRSAHQNRNSSSHSSLCFSFAPRILTLF